MDEMTKAETRLHDLAMRFYHEVEMPSDGDWGVVFQCLIKGNEDLLRAMVEQK